MPTILPGRFNWHELLTTDPAAAQGFYQSVVGWGNAPWGNDGYVMWMNGQVSPYAPICISVASNGPWVSPIAR